MNFKKKKKFFTCVTSRYLAACLCTSVVDLGAEFVHGLLRFIDSLIPIFPQGSSSVCLCVVWESSL